MRLEQKFILNDSELVLSMIVVELSFHRENETMRMIVSISGWAHEKKVFVERFSGGDER